MPHKVTIIGVYYADVLHNKRVTVKEQLHGKLTVVSLRAIHQFSGTSSQCQFLVPVAGRQIEHALY